MDGGLLINLERCYSRIANTSYGSLECFRKCEAVFGQEALQIKNLGWWIDSTKNGNALEGRIGSNCSNAPTGRRDVATGDAKRTRG